MKSIRQILYAMGLIGPVANSIARLSSPRVSAKHKVPAHIQAWKMQRAAAKRVRKAARREREIELARKGTR